MTNLHASHSPCRACQSQDHARRPRNARVQDRVKQIALQPRRYLGTGYIVTRYVATPPHSAADGGARGRDRPACPGARERRLVFDADRRRTSDVSDSGLIPNLIQPAFKTAYPQFTFKYIGTATGTAITDAENGTNGPSVLIVHAASLENQFVGHGFSYDNRTGSAIFINDFVLAGPTGRPGRRPRRRAAQHRAGVRRCRHGRARRQGDVRHPRRPRRAGHDRRGARALGARLQLEPDPAGLVLCKVNADGRRRRNADRRRQRRHARAAVPGQRHRVRHRQLPSWYFVTGRKPGPQRRRGQLLHRRLKSGPNSCYVLTDRGTYDYLASVTTRRDGPESADRHARRQRLGPRRRLRAGQLLPRLHHQPVQGRARP